MARTIAPLQFGDDTVYIEVADVESLDGTGGKESQKAGVLKGFEKTSAVDEIQEAGEQVRSTISALASTVRQALQQAQPDEWSLEINLGFKGKAGIPFITEGEANGAVKVIAKWRRGS